MTKTRSSSQKQRFTGRVVAVGRMKETVSVAVDYTRTIPKVRKRVRRTSVFLVHDQEGVARLGERVVIVATRPRSKRKHFRIVQVISPARGTQLSSGDQVSGLQGPLELASTSSGRGEPRRGNRSGSHPKP
jgi:small subunit ribosomal protein S17